MPLVEKERELVLNPRQHFWKIVFVLGLLALAFTASTAYACGCGIYIPREGEAAVSQERSLVRWDGTREDIVMSLGVLGGSKQAAIILPIPSHADVKLADGKVFEELDEMTKPLIREERQLTFSIMLGAAGAPPPGGVGAGAPVNVLSRQDVGPFDVANLSATDANALKDWLDENGFQLDPRIPTVLQPYVDKGWTFVAVRLQPEQASGELGGTLSPLQISFDASELVYPMRASALAKNSQDLALYVLADHRVDKDFEFGMSRVSFANWVEPSALNASSTLAPYVPRKFFLTKFVETINPPKVHDDFHFRFAQADTPFREVRIVTVKEDATGYVLLGCFTFMALGVLALVAAAIIIARNRHHASNVQRLTS